jgi:hypothetical protein
MLIPVALLPLFLGLDFELCVPFTGPPDGDMAAPLFWRAIATKGETSPAYLERPAQTILLALQARAQPSLIRPHYENFHHRLHEEIGGDVLYATDKRGRKAPY